MGNFCSLFHAESWIRILMLLCSVNIYVLLRELMLALSKHGERAQAQVRVSVASFGPACTRVMSNLSAGKLKSFTLCASTELQWALPVQIPAAFPHEHPYWTQAVHVSVVRKGLQHETVLRRTHEDTHWWVASVLHWHLAFGLVFSSVLVSINSWRKYLALKLPLADMPFDPSQAVHSGFVRVFYAENLPNVMYWELKEAEKPSELSWSDRKFCGQLLWVTALNVTLL